MVHALKFCNAALAFTGQIALGISFAVIPPDEYSRRSALLLLSDAGHSSGQEKPGRADGMFYILL
jgi:hypothetical protein